MRNLALLMTAATAMLLTACPPTYPNCQSDENCAEKSEVCVQGQCHECATDANCKPGFVCDTGTFKCEPKPECVGETGCGPGKKCKAGKCAVDTAKVEGSCVSKDDCTTGQDCKGNRCVPAADSTASCSYEPVRFELNEFTLSASSQAALAATAECIKKLGLRFTLEGNADERGTEEFNMVLSQKRAASVRVLQRRAAIAATWAKAQTLANDTCCEPELRDEYHPIPRGQRRSRPR